MTDALAKFNDNAPRSTWTAQLEGTWTYLAHRSFSWLILLATGYGLYLSKKDQMGGLTASQIGVGAIVLIQMVLGLVMSQIHIYAWVQVLHVGLAAILLSLSFRWVLTRAASKTKWQPKS